MTQNQIDANYILTTVKAKVNEVLANYPAIDGPVGQLSEKVGVEKPFVALGIVLIPFLLLLFFGSGDFAVDMIGFLYPVYASIKAIESNEKSDDNLWLTYWLIFALFKFFESIADVFISSIPYYFVTKVGFLVWCFLPQTKGATIVYDMIVKPYIVPHLNLDTKKTD